MAKTEVILIAQHRWPRRRVRPGQGRRRLRAKLFVPAGAGDSPDRRQQAPPGGSPAAPGRARSPRVQHHERPGQEPLQADLPHHGQDRRRWQDVRHRHLGHDRRPAQTQFNVTLDKKKIHLEHPIRALGDHEIELRLHQDVATTLKLRVESSTPLPEPPTAPAAEAKKEEPKTEKRGRRPEAGHGKPEAGDKKPHAAARTERHPRPRAPKPEKPAGANRLLSLRSRNYSSTLPKAAVIRGIPPKRLQLTGSQESGPLGTFAPGPSLRRLARGGCECHTWTSQRAEDGG